MMTTRITATLRAAVVGLALGFLILPAAPIGGIVPIPTVGGEASAYGGPTCQYESDYYDCSYIAYPPEEERDYGDFICASSWVVGTWAVRGAWAAAALIAAGGVPSATGLLIAGALSGYSMFASSAC